MPSRPDAGRCPWGHGGLISRVWPVRLRPPQPVDFRNLLHGQWVRVAKKAPPMSGTARETGKSRFLWHLPGQPTLLLCQEVRWPA